MSLPLVFILCLVTTVAAQTTESNPACGNTTYYCPVGEITSPEFPGYYPINLDCDYNVYAETKCTITFTFTFINTEENHDWVTISCPTNPGFEPKSYSGDSRPNPIVVPSCSHGLVNFISDGDYVNTGFRIEYECTDPETTISDISLAFESTPETTPDPTTMNEATTARETTAPETTAQGTTAPETTAQGTTAPETTAPETTAPETTAPETTAPETTAPETTAPETTAPETTAPETTAPETTAQETTLAETTQAGTTEEFRHTTLQEETTRGEDTTSAARTSAEGTTLDEETTSVARTTEDFRQSTAPETTLREEITTVAETTEFAQTTRPPPVTTSPPDTTNVASTMDLAQTTQDTPDITQNPACGVTSYEGPYGVITSPNYPLLYDRNLDCYYYVHASSDSSISFIFKAFNTEANYYDYVNISCETNSSLPYRRFSGQSLPEPVSLPWCSLGVVHFHSDEGNVDTGFSLNYYVSEGGCGNTVYNESHGFVTSPNWQSEYGLNHDCLNIIWAPERSTFNLIFLSFTLDSCCNCDWLEIRCLDNSENGPYTYCGSNSVGSVDITECSQTLLWFHTDGSLTNAGFNIEYNVNLAGETAEESIDYQLNSPPPPGCGNDIYNGPSGNITSPNYPGNYYDSLKCTYYINSSVGSSFSFIFNHFDVQVYKDYLAISCGTNDTFPEQQYTGHTLPPPLSIPWCSQASLFFFTDTTEVYTGYSIDYYVSVGGCGNTTYTASSGNVTSPNYPNVYGENHDCYNIIWAPQPSHFQLEFTDFDVQDSVPCQLDWVEVSCLDNNPSNKHRFCGDIVYSLDFYQCTQVLVWFHSDGATNSQGFNLEYNINVVSGCGEETYYGPSGNITSPNFPEFYNNSLFCDYTIDTGSSSGSIAIIFSAFFTEKCCDYVTISCATNDSYSPVELSGLIDAPPPVSIPSCSLGNVNFRTDITTGAPGFSLEYYVSTGGCGNTVYAEMPGVVSSPNYPGEYDVNQNCFNIIYVAKPLPLLTITFIHMNIEECCDWVELSCLDNPAYGTHQFTGNVIPPAQNIPECGQILVYFYSDYSTVLDGFSLQYSAAAASDSRS